jgi:hypothetical protein
MNHSITRRNFVAALAFSALLFLTLSPARAQAQHYSDWSAPENLGATVNTAALEGCPFIAKDNVTLFLASNRAGGSGSTDIYASQRESEDSPWGTPFNLGTNINSAGAEVCPTLTISERYLYFVSNRAGGCGGDDIYVSRRVSKKDLTSWDPAENLGCQFNSPANDITPSLIEDEDGTVYLFFSSNRAGGLGGMDIYVSTSDKDGVFGTPVPVSELNTTFNDQRPNVRRRDGLEIFFESDRTGTIGMTDLYSSLRETTSSAWSAPVNLGAIVNSIAAEGRPSLSWDGTELYFMSTRAGGFGSNDIYVTRRTKNPDEK